MNFQGSTSIKIIMLILIASLEILSVADAKPVPKIYSTADGPPGFLVTNLQGHTAHYNAVATIDVMVKSRPKHEVRIPIRSSDPGEGIVLNADADEITELIFTPVNWRRSQMVIIKGRNKNVIDGKQDYSIILGPSKSKGLDYHDLSSQDVYMKGIILELIPPVISRKIIFSGEEVTLDVSASYSQNSKSDLRYELLEGPLGMVLHNHDPVLPYSKPSSGSAKLKWTPDKVAEGQTYSVKVRVSDGVKLTNGFRNDEASFSVTVQSAPIPLETEVTERTITITDLSTDLQGLHVEMTEEQLSPRDFHFYKLSADELPSNALSPATDFFEVKSELFNDPSDRSDWFDYGPSHLRIPVARLSPDISWKTHKVYLYHWRGEGELVGTQGGFWNPSYFGSFLTINGEKFVEFDLSKGFLHGLYYIAFHEYERQKE